MWVYWVRTRKIWKLSKNNSRGDQRFNETLFFIFIKSFCKVWSIVKRILKYSWNKLDGFCKEISNLLNFTTAVGGGIRGSKKVFPTCMDGRTVGHALLSRYVEVVLNIDKLTVPEIIQSINHSFNQSNLIPSINSSTWQI